MPPSGLPIDEALPGLRAALSQHSAAVLVAPPGGGKTAVAPLDLRAEPWIAAGKIVVLEPRRLAARAAAGRVAATLGEPVGQTVGFRVRLQSKVSAATRIEVVTEGVFTRQILADPELAGVACVIFDEFHERSLDADLGLALARDAQALLRDDLRLLVMSATLDGAAVARLLADAPVIESLGRAFPVETHYLGRDERLRREDRCARAVERPLAAQTGGLPGFRPGQGQTKALPAYGDPEILDADFSGLALDLARWGAKDATALAFLDPPPAAAFAEARALLVRLEALTDDGVLTEHGRALADMPLPPRLAHMVLKAAETGQAPRAARIAALITERNLGGRDIDLRPRLEGF